MSENGRLSAAELDEVLGAGGHAVDLTPPPPDRGPDQQSTGTDRPGWAGRGRLLAGRHPRLSAGVLLGAIAVAGGTWSYLTSGPPPLLTSIAADAEFEQGFTPPAGTQILAGSEVRAELTLTAASPADPVRAVALLGPGLVDAQASQLGTQVTTRNVLDCTAIPDLTTIPRYLLRVAQTDPWGRTVTRDLELTGPVIADAGAMVTRACVAQAADRVVLHTVRYEVGPPAVLRLRVQNPGPRDLWVNGANPTFGPAHGTLRLTGRQTLALPAGELRDLSFRPTLTDCLSLPVLASDPARDADPGRRAGDLALQVGASSDGDERVAELTYLPLTPAQRRTVWAAMTGPCTGAPALTYAVHAVTLEPAAGPDAAVSFTLAASSPTGTVNLRLSDIFLSDPADLAGASFGGNWSGAGSVTAVGQPPIAAATRTRLRWQVLDCPATVQSGPPTFRAVVTVGGRSYPYLLVLGSPDLLTVLTRACRAQLPPGFVRSNGWAVR